MKINKKVLVPVFATAMGLSVLGGVSGAVAWYQYNNKVTASFIGVSVTDKGVLQISEDGSNWTRSLDKTTNPKLQLKPVTFGDTSTGIGDKQAWKYPEAGAGNGYYKGVYNTPGSNKPGWEEASTADYIAFDLYFNAYDNDATETGGKKYVERPVYISNNFLRCLDSSGNEDASHLADQALRIQFDFDSGDPIIISKAGATTKLSDELDLDGSGDSDVYVNNPFIVLPEGAVVGDPVIYGNATDPDQVSTAISTYQVGGTPLFTTSGTATPVHVKVTIWLEGWAVIGSSAVWDASKTAGCDVQAALEFATDYSA